MKYIYSTSQVSKLSLTLHTFSVTGSVAGLFLTLCLCCISCHFFSSTLASFYEILEGAGEDIIIQKQERKSFFSIYILLT